MKSHENIYKAYVPYDLALEEWLGIEWKMRSFLVGWSVGWLVG